MLVTTSDPQDGSLLGPNMTDAVIEVESMIRLRKLLHAPEPEPTTTSSVEKDYLGHDCPSLCPEKEKKALKRMRTSSEKELLLLKASYTFSQYVQSLRVSSTSAIVDRDRGDAFRQSSSAYGET